MKSALTFAFAVLATIVACAEPNLDEPEPLPTSDAPPRVRDKGSSPSPSASGSGSADAPPPPPPIGPGGGTPAGAKRWVGTLPVTKPVQFGGTPYCDYKITLQQVRVELVAATNGDIIAATVTATALEEVGPGSCGAPIPVNTHTYSLATAKRLPSGVTHLELSRGAANHPAASLVIEADFLSSYPELSLEWHRTDNGPPLDWRVRAQITVAPT